MTDLPDASGIVLTLKNVTINSLCHGIKNMVINYNFSEIIIATVICIEFCVNV